LRHAGSAIRYLPRMWPIITLVLLAVVSMAWSDYPDITMRRSASLATVTLWGLVRYRAIRSQGCHLDLPACDRGHGACLLRRHRGSARGRRRRPHGAVRMARHLR
jgi:hypothetical protein